MVNRIRELYDQGKSAKEVGDVVGWSWRQVISCMQRNGISRRSRSEATYRKANPTGDPFHVKFPLSEEEERLKALARGLFWGEGTRRNRLAVRISNSDPALLRVFVEFLRTICGVRADKIRVWLVLHADVSPMPALRYWSRQLGIPLAQFSKPTIIPSRGRGTYKYRSQWGTATVHVGNMRLRRLVQDWLTQYAHVAQSAERVVGNDEVAGSIPAVGLREYHGNGSTGRG